MMKTSTAVLVLLSSFALCSAIPASDESQSLKESVRQKRGGWGYNYYNSYMASAPAAASTYISTPPVQSKSSFTPGTSYVAPPVTAVHSSYVPDRTTRDQSYVYQSSPEYTYSVYQTHPNSYYSYPANYYHYNPYYMGAYSG